MKHALLLNMPFIAFWSYVSELIYSIFWSGGLPLLYGVDPIGPKTP